MQDKLLVLLEEIGNTITSNIELEDVLALIYEKSRKIIEHDLFAIELLDESSTILRTRFCRGVGKIELEDAEFGWNEGYAGWVLKNKKPFITGDAENEIRTNIKFKKLILDHGLKSFFVVPLKIENKIVGVFIFASQQRDAYNARVDSGQVSMVRIIATMAAVAINSAKLTEDAKKRDKQREMFSRELRHHLLSPLEAIQQFTTFIIEGVSKDKEKDYLKTIKEEVARYSEFINNIFLFYDISYGTLTINPTRIDIWEIITSAVRSVKFDADKKNIKIQMENEISDSDDITIGADKYLIYQVFWNLLRNAIKYTRNGGEVNVRLFRNENIFLEIKDTGVGISEEDIKHIFELGYRGKDKEIISEEGIGYGLCIVKGSIKAHGDNWKIDVESKKGEGSKFTVTIPIGGTPVPTKNVLIIDDEEKWLTISRQILEEKGKDYTVHCMKMRHIIDESVILKTAIEGNWDLILLDIIMPGKDPQNEGIHICEKLNRHPRTKNIPIIMFSIRNDPDARKDSIKAGAVDYISKMNLNADEFLQKIEANILKNDIGKEYICD
ncbi:hypothetical protein BEH94_11480 [Candidatus Altiarchaeales archaeon WOR_SM1_SCG]|nr:hypothetical protein BEH94_11480 [Candidatus Altiarchaeales archaeon WOR_SM1_SCG]